MTPKELNQQVELEINAETESLVQLILHKLIAAKKLNSRSAGIKLILSDQYSIEVKSRAFSKLKQEGWAVQGIVVPFASEKIWYFVGSKNYVVQMIKTVEEFLKVKEN